METVRTIQAIGPRRRIIESDFGQLLHVDSVDGLCILIRAPLAFGVNPDEISLMLKDNPAHIMWLDDQRVEEVG